MKKLLNKKNALSKVLFLLLLATPGLSAGEIVKPVPADTIADSVGVNFRATYDNTPNRQNFYASTPDQSLKNLFQELGVRHVRDGFPLPSAHWHRQNRQNLASLYRDLGIKFLPVIDDRINVNVGGRMVEILNQSLIDGRLDDIEKGVVSLDGVEYRLVDMVEGMEGPNEYDHHHTAHLRDPNWEVNLTNFQKALATKFASRPSLNGMRLLGPSLIYQEYCHRPALSMGQFVQLGNLHSYPTIHDPSGPPYWDWGNPTSNIGGFLYHGDACFKGRKMWVTETGYRHKEQGIDERTVAKYLSRLILEYYQHGIERTYLYTMVDDLPEQVRGNGNWGLIEPNLNEKHLNKDSNGNIINYNLYNPYTLRPRLSFFAVKSLINLLGEGKWDRATKSWSVPKVSLRDVDISFSGKTADTKHFLVQKSNDDYILFLWRDVKVFNNKQKNFNAPTVPISVTLPNGYSFRSTISYNSSFTFDELPIATPNKNVTVNVPDQLIALRFKEVPNVIPEATDDVVSVTAGQSVSINALSNDRDPDNGPTPLKIYNTSQPSKGSVVLGVNSQLNYTANGSSSGVDTFTYSVTDGKDFAAAKVTVNITALPPAPVVPPVKPPVVVAPPAPVVPPVKPPVVVAPPVAPPKSNKPPVAGRDTITFSSLKRITFNVLKNDSDPDKGPKSLTLTRVTGVQRGELSFKSDGTVSYNPKRATSTESLRYVISDGAATAEGTIVISPSQTLLRQSKLKK